MRVRPAMAVLLEYFTSDGARFDSPRSGPMLARNEGHSDDRADLALLLRGLTKEEMALCRMRYGAAAQVPHSRYRFPSYEEIGTALGLTPRQAKRELAGAIAKVEAAMARRALHECSGNYAGRRAAQKRS